ncbi:general transcription factor 3C polypeptide 3-like [Antedon mediterranea]|uniref:general transcription factor 3C polypeptide 3-like n=1 Tax=Antedon mediterranea TaxID=105859 RepID=UPI003AF67F11
MSRYELVDEGELLKYLRGEISFEQWSDGQKLTELLEDVDKLEDETTDIREPELQHDVASSDEEFEEPMTSTNLIGEEASTSAMIGASISLGAPGDDAFEIELEMEKEKRKTGKKRHFNRLPKTLRGLMGEANLCFARGAREDAIKMCLEIIREAPRSYEPYQLLGMMYEDQGDNEKALQFLLIAAHLNPKDTDEWVKLAEMCLEQNSIKQAINCYTTALKQNQQNIGLIFQRAKLYEKCGEHKRAIESYHRIVTLLPENKGEQCLNIARDMARSCHLNKDITSAINIFEKAVSKHPSLITSEDVNMLAELHICQKQHQRALQVISDHCGVQMISGDTSALIEQIDQVEFDPGLDVTSIEVKVPEELPIDLRVKLGVCLIHEKYVKASRVVLQDLFDQSVDEFGDLFLDVAEAYMEVGYYGDAKPIIAPLVQSDGYNLAAVWLRYAECLNALEEKEHAASAYRRVLELAPLHVDARLALSAIEQQLGRSQAALDVLTNDSQMEEECSTEKDIQLIHQKCMLLYTQGNMREFANQALKMMAHYFSDTFHHHNTGMSAESSTRKQKRMLKYQRELRVKADREPCELIGDDSLINKEVWWELFKKVCEALGACKDYVALHHLLSSAMWSTRLSNFTEKLREIGHMMIFASYLSGDFLNPKANWYLRNTCRMDGYNNQSWNLLGLMMAQHHDMKFLMRFCLRLTIRKYPDSFALSLLNGHNAFYKGSYKHALGEYVRGYKMNPDSDMTNLFIALTFLHIACQKFPTKRQMVIMQAVVFFKEYQRLRGNIQETSYNIGRAMHHLGLYHLAIHFYEEALKTAPSIEGDETFDLRREAAFNLSLIYRSSGNEDLANHILMTHIVV